MAHAHCMLDTKGYKQTLIIYNTFLFTATMVAQKIVDVTSYVLYLSCYIITKHFRPGSVLTGTDWDLLGAIISLVGK